jgi:hypothetical protein
MPHETPMIREAEFAGRNSGLETVANSLAVCKVDCTLEEANPFSPRNITVAFLMTSGRN